MSKSMKKAVLLNDTSGRYHHGCNQVMRVLNDRLRAENIMVSASSPAHTDWRKDATFLLGLKACDLVIINGEGTLHNGAPKGRILLDILEDDRREGRPVALVNALWQNNPVDWAASASKCGFVSTRDTRSQAELQATGMVQVNYMPDLSLADPRPASLSAREGLLVGDSVRLEVRKALAAVAQRQTATYLPTKTLKHALWQNRLAAKLLWRVYNQTFTQPVPPFIMSPTEADYLDTLSAVSGHITGRFHGVCLSMVSETPFLAVPSKTSKVEMLLQDACLEADRLVTLDQLLAGARIEVPPFSAFELGQIRAFRESAYEKSKAFFKQIRDLA